MYTVGSLFSGIGGIDLGFERAGFTTSWQVEIEPYCRKVLEKNFPHAQRFVDVRECGAHNLSRVDVIAGGFPCQDISNAGLRAGIDGERSGLWREFHRIIGELRPSFVFVENVAALLGRGASRVLGDLSEIGYDAEWEVVSAADVGAPHLRERFWLVAYPYGYGCHSRGVLEARAKGEAFGPACAPSEQRTDSSRSEAMAYTCRGRFGEPGGGEMEQSWRTEAIGGGEVMAYPTSPRRPEGLCGACGEIWDEAWRQEFERRSYALADTCSQGLQDSELETVFGKGWREEGRAATQCGEARSVNARWWAVEPNVGRVAYGIPARVDRLRALGNAVVPQIPEMFAREIRKALDAQKEQVT